MRDEQEHSDAAKRQASDDDKRESGRPGGGQGRRDDVGKSGVYPMSGGAENAPEDAELRGMAEWGQGERGAAGYEDSGGSELMMHDGELLGGLTAGPGGEPTIDIHGGDRPEKHQRSRKNDRDERR